MLKLCFFVPESHLESVKEAVFSQGAGKIGQYDQCCWQVKGMGQFRPLKGSQPYLGQANQLEVVEEYRVEMVLERKFLKAVIMALKDSHPYEEPAFEVFEMVKIDQ
ncbi:NGG1p interacting factor NIF3 [Hydrogenovibrio sp. SC-1]|uniref:NGG1p interacting factor NIF3 n=1 Tax=Hydrogenovibrio sp. SC-1 TaxID=2065820 RepID=UPI000C7B31F5|nr:NGG1p interacting factor NIF3 [Hydrogenovibrio sp. SC-1]PLA75011.1 NGG1p interacting factor NIF3 [Hydrogenovibrio sp. SC-1]